MGLDISKYKAGGRDFGRAEDGLYPARLTQVIELGVQPMEDYQTGEAKDPKPRAILTFELPTETIEINGEDKPRWYGKEYTLSSHELAGILKVMKALDASGATDLTEMVGKACTVQLGTTISGKAKIINVSPIMKGIAVPPLSKAPLVFDLDDPSLDVFKGFPDWVKEKITGALDFEGSVLCLLLEGSSEKSPGDF